MNTTKPTIAKTEITYEEWWAAEKKRLLRGTGPTTREVVHHCLKCKKNFGPHGHECADGQEPDLFDVCDRVMIHY